MPFRTDFRQGAFPHGANWNDVPLHANTPGKVFWVASTSDVTPGSNGNKGTERRPFATLDYAITQCRDNKGDVIFIKPGYTESITTNDQIDFTKAGVSVIGLGTDTDRPTFTWDGTDATACIAMEQANCSIRGCLFISSDAGDDITRLISIEADNCEVAYCEFREGTGQPNCCINVIDGVDRAHIHHNKATSLTNGAAANDSFVTLNADTTAATGHRIHNNYVHGTYDQACIWVADATQILSDILIYDNILINTATSLYAIDLTSGTNVTGMIAGNRVETDAEATSIRSGGATLVDNRWGLDTKQSVTPGQNLGAAAVSVAPQMTITATAADEVAVVTSGGPIIITSIVGFCNTLHEAEAAAVFDNIVTGASGNLYTADQETALQDSSFEVGDYVVFAQNGPVVVEQATSQTEDSRGLNWMIAASDTIDIEGGSAEAEGKVTLVINYISLGGELEVESV
jgi:hypothetical protein